MTVTTHLNLGCWSCCLKCAFVYTQGIPAIYFFHSLNTSLSLKKSQCCSRGDFICIECHGVWFPSGNLSQKRVIFHDVHEWFVYPLVFGHTNFWSFHRNYSKPSRSSWPTMFWKLSTQLLSFCFLSYGMKPFTVIIFSAVVILLPLQKPFSSGQRIKGSEVRKPIP